MERFNFNILRSSFTLIISILFISFFTFDSYSQDTKTLYLIPGQGSDYRIFKHFDFQEYDTVNVKYPIPESNDSMKSYALKLLSQIDTTKPFSIIGVSLGGMLAVELSEIIDPEEVIIISSAKNKNDLPMRYKFMSKIPLNKLFGGNLLIELAPLAQIIVEPDSHKERETCKSMLKNKNELFMKYSLNMIINWSREENTKDIIHIHGTNDHTIPIRNISKVNFELVNGSHMMALTKGKEIKTMIDSILN